MKRKSFLRLYRCRGLRSFLPRRGKKPLVLFLFALHRSFFSSNVFAECLTFGPRQFTRQTGKPFVEQASFNKTNPLGGPYKLIILNGTESGGNRISSANIWLNGQSIASPSDFNQHVYIIEKDVTLQDSNLLEVELRSSPGSFITIRIVDQDQTPPAVSLNPLPACLNTPAITVTGSTDDHAAAIKVNGADASIGSGPTSGPFPFSAPVSLSEGQNLITATATDRCNNAATAQTSVTLDTFPPGVTITYPSYGSVTNIPELVVEGQVNDPNALVSFNGISCPVENLVFRCPSVTLSEEGRVDITVSAVDPCGNSSSAQVSILYIAVDAWGWIDPEGGIVEVTNPDSSIYSAKITIPADALQTLTLITIDALSYGIPYPASGLLIVGNPVEFGPSGTTFSYPATACITYDENLLHQVDSGEAAVSFMVYDPITDFYTKIPTAYIDMDKNLVCAEISHFSVTVPVC